MQRASIDPGLRRWQLRLIGAVVASSVSTSVAVTLALLGVGAWPFALLGLPPGLMLGALFGPLAARTTTPVAAAFFAGFVGYFVALGMDFAGLALLSAFSATRASTGGELTPLAHAALLLYWGMPVLFLGGIPGALTTSFVSVGAVRQLNALPPRQVATVLAVAVLALATAAAIAGARVSSANADADVRSAALFDGPIDLDVAYANLSPGDFELEVRYAASDESATSRWSGVADVYTSCSSGSGGFNLQPGWEMYLRGALGAQLIASATRQSGTSASVTIFIDQDGVASLDDLGRLPSEDDPRWQECVAAGGGIH